MEKKNFRDQIFRNKVKSVFLMAIIFVVFILFGFVISLGFGEGYFFMIMIFAIIFSLGYILLNYYKSDKIALASVKAKKAPREKYTQYHSTVEGLTLASGMPKPELYVMPSKQINAFAAGRNPENSVICVTEGALEKLDKNELEAVLGHELGHVANYDIRYMTFATVMVGLISIISELFLWNLWLGGGDNDEGGWIFIVIGIVMAILAPIVVQLVQFAISRKREFAADASSVKFTRYPDAMIRALEKIEKDSLGSRSEGEKEREKEKQKVSKALAPLFISNPLKNMEGLTSTHPPVKKRIDALRKM